MLFEHQLPSGEKVTLFKSGIGFFDELERLIDAAEKEIHFQVYIFDKDETGSRIMNALLRAAERGVIVYLLIDGYGSLLLPSATIARLRNSGIRLKLYGKLIRNWRFHIGRRLHRKIIVFDQKKAIVAGLNISDNYNDIGEKKAWLDFAVRVEGQIVSRLHDLCLQLWMKKSFRRAFKRKKEQYLLPGSQRLIRVRQNDWIRGLNEANATYRREISHAKESIFIVGGYFLPGGLLRRMLKRAIDRGVKIQLIVAERSDVDLHRGAMLYLYRWMLRNKITVYEYLPSNVHGKVLIADRSVVSIGSYDLNNLSTYSNIELNLNIADNMVASNLQDRLEKIALEDCRLVTLDDFSKRDTYWRMFRHWIAYQLVKSLFVLSVKLSTREDDER